MKQLLLIPALLGVFAASAQTSAYYDGTPSDPTPVPMPQFGIKGGYNSANISINSDGEVNDKNSLSSFNAGAYVDLPLLPILSIQPGLMVSGKGAKYTVGNNTTASYRQVQINPIYLELPVNAVVKLPLGGSSNIFLGAGPYAALGLGGKVRTEGSLLGVRFENEDNIQFGNDEPDDNGNTNSGTLKRYDFGANVLAGIQLSRFTINANYGFGFTDVCPGADNRDDNNYKNRVLSFSVGFLF